MRQENYKEEINFTEEQIKIDRKRDPAMEYSYEDKSSIFRKMSKARAEKKMHEKGHLGYKEDVDTNSLGDDYYSESDYSSSEENNSKVYGKAKSWLEKNTTKESKDLFGELRKDYKTIQNNIENKGFSNKSKKTKSNGYKTCANCGARMYDDAKVCPKCGETQKNQNPIAFILSKIGKLIFVILIINMVIGLGSFLFMNDSSEPTPEPGTSTSFIDYGEYKKPISLKYLVPEKDIVKIDKEEVSVGPGKDITAGEYIFIKNEGVSLGEVEVYSILDKDIAELSELVHRNYYLKLDEGDTVKLKDGVLYRADQVELDMTNDDNKKSGMYRIGKDVGETFTVSGNGSTFYSILDEDNIIIVNGFLDEGDLKISPEFIEENSIQGESAKYVQICDGILIPE